jgi:hypothetical protein
MTPDGSTHEVSPNPPSRGVGTPVLKREPQGVEKREDILSRSEAASAAVSRFGGTP